MLLRTLCFIILIESGMRFSIWNGLRDINPSASDYKLNLINYDRIETGFMGCIGHSEKKYLIIPYTLWLIKDVFLAKIICQYRGEHIFVYIKTDNNHIDKSYYWSFRKWQFINIYNNKQD